MRQQPFASPEEALEHFGTKGMRWGVRNDDAPKEKVKSFVQEPITRTTKNGEQFTLTPLNKSQGRFMQTMARKFPHYRDYIENSAILDIKDKGGNTIGNAQVHRVSKDELNLVWLDIEKSNRGQGYATAVMGAARDLGGAQGFKKLTLEVPGISPDARHIYEKLGFEVVKEPTVLGKKDIWGGLTHMQYDYEKSKTLQQSEWLINDVLVHFGIKGMRWGYRNESRARTENFGKPYTHADGLGHGSKIFNLKKPEKLRVESKDGVIDIRPKDGFKSKRAEQYHKEMLDGVHEMRKEYPALRDMKIEITPMSHQPGGRMMILMGVPAAAAHLKPGEARLFYNDRMRGDASKISSEARKIQPGIQHPGFLGRHEMGHVLSMAGNQMPSGWKTTHDGNYQDMERLNAHINESHKALFKKHGMSFDEVSKLSPYAATEPAEAFAEAAAYLHTPALKSQMSPVMQVKVKAMLDDVGGKKP